MSDISRVTQNSAAMLMVSDMDSDLSGLTLLQEQAASGKALNQPSDNPTGTSEVMSMNTQIGRYQQYATNAGDGLSRLQTASGALNSVTEALNQVQTDVLSGANASASDSSDRQALSADVLSIKQEILGYAGATYNDKSVFSGTYGTSPYPQGSTSGISDPTSASYDPATAYAYAGSTTPITRVVAPGQSVNASITGNQVFGSGTSSVFALLDTISQDLSSGNTSALNGSDLTQLHAAMNTVTQAGGNTGSLSAAITQNQTSANDTVSSLQIQVGNITDANEDQVATSLDLAEASYQAALETTAKIIQPSLAQFLS
jgi:flagellar hook-associated protein 3 FlgL